MSKKVGAHIKCPSCGTETEFYLYRSLWIEDPENRKMVFEDRVNLFECPSCGRSERAKFPFLCTNTKEGFAVWYEPYHDEAIDKDVEGYRKTMGTNSFYATAPRIQDWDEFKKAIVEFEKSNDKIDAGIEISKESAAAFDGFLNDVVAKEIKNIEPTHEEKSSDPVGRFHTSQKKANKKATRWLRLPEWLRWVLCWPAIFLGSVITGLFAYYLASLFLYNNFITGEWAKVLHLSIRAVFSTYGFYFVLMLLVPRRPDIVLGVWCLILLLLSAFGGVGLRYDYLNGEEFWPVIASETLELIVLCIAMIVAFASARKQV